MESSSLKKLLRIAADFWIIIFITLLCVHCAPIGYNVFLATAFTAALTAVFHVKSLPRIPAHVLEKAIGGDKEVKVIAHRGGGHEAPENTLAAFKQARHNGGCGVEFDLEFTSDGSAILLHDDTVDRTTDGSGRITNLHVDDVRRLNAAATHRLSGDGGVHEQIPTLEETIDTCLKLGLIMFIDVKRDHPRLTAVLTSMYKKWPELYSRAFVCSFYPHIIYKLRRMDSHMLTGLTWRPHVLTYSSPACTKLRNKETWKQWLAPPADMLLTWALHSWLWYLCGVSMFLVHKSVCSIEYTARWRARGVRPVLWTVNTGHEKRYAEHVLHCSYMTDTLVSVEDTAHDACHDECRHELILT